MKVLPSRLLKIAAIAALVVSSGAQAYCACAQIAAQYASQAQASVLTKLSTCDQYKADPTAYQACTSPIYLESLNMYQYVYNQAYSGCNGACPR
jgi:hypothetical protein